MVPVLLGTILLWNPINKKPAVVVANVPTKTIKLDLYTNTWRDDPAELDADQIKSKLEAAGYKVITKKTGNADLVLKVEYEEELGYEIKPYGMGTNVNFAFWLLEPDGTEIFSDRTLVRQREKSKHPTEETLAKFESSSFYAVFGEYVRAVAQGDIEPLTALLSKGHVAAAEALCGIESEEVEAILQKQLKQSGNEPIAEVIRVGLGLEYE